MKYVFIWIIIMGWFTNINAQDTIVENQQTDNRVTPSKTLKFDTIKSIPNKTGEVPYSVSHGQFLEGKLYNGKIDYYNSRNELVISKLIRKGEEQEDYFYKDKEVNRFDSLGRRTGLWVSPLPALLYDEYRTIKNAENLYQGINHIENYMEGVKVDTSYTYSKEGWLASKHISGRDSIPPQTIHYFFDGRISKIDFYVTDTKYRFLRSETVYYSDTLADCVIKRETYNQQKLTFTYKYINCQLYSKTSVKEEYGKTEKARVTRYLTIVTDGGNSETIAIEEAIDLIPTLEPIPYTTEIGNFDASEKYLVNGVINYFNAQGILIETKKVTNGVISN